MLPKEMYLPFTSSPQPRTIASIAGTPTDQLEISDQVVFVDNSLSTSNTIKMPSVGRARGLWYSVYKMNDDAKAVNIDATGDSVDEAGLESIQLTAQFHSIHLFSDGVKWHILSRHDANVDAGGEARTVDIIIPAANGKAGATAGWVNSGSDPGNISAASLPASQSASTYTIPIVGLQIGSVVNSYKVIGQIESGGNAVTLDADLRKLTTAAGDHTDASIGAITQVSKTADYKVEESKTLSAAETIALGESLYLLLTGTTAAATDIKISAVVVNVTIP